MPDITIKKIFVCEFITAGGLNHAHLNHADLPSSLVQEGELMRDALLRDLAQLSYHISTTVDARLSKPQNCHDCIEIDADSDAWLIWAQQISQVDAVWLIAPETDGMLKKLTELAVLQGKLVLGCTLESIEMFSHKLATYQALTSVGISTIATYTPENWPNADSEWVIKPNDGAGCSDMLYFGQAQALTDWLSNSHKASTHVIQPYQEGIAASISCVMHQGHSQLLACNKQLINIENNAFKYAGSQVNGMQHYWDAFESLAQKIAKSDMGLNGYIGIDVIVKPDDEVVVVEINPRLTTSYVGLAQATGQNPVALIINTLTQSNFKWPILQRHIVSIHV